MSLLLIVVLAAAVLGTAYWLYGGLLARLFRLDPDAQTPAVTMRDDVDYSPIEPKFLLSQHFSAIAAAGPIVGPILAGLMFGWGPALIWILVGAIFIGGVHDMGALIASVRHKARSIAEVVREHMSRRSYILFLLFVWIALIYIIVAFTDVVAGSFVGINKLDNGMEIQGGGIASSSLLYLALPIIMGLLLRYTKLSLNWATAIFLPLVGVAIWCGRFVPLDFEGWFGLQQHQAHKLWDVLLLVYCFVASLSPMWLLLQPRGHLGGFFLYVALASFAIGLLFGGKTAQYPAFVGWNSLQNVPLFPMLFITIACGACSGFHSIIASGTTSKQLRKETDARVIGYGTMLLEGLVAITSLCCVMVLTPAEAKAFGGKPDLIYASGLAGFLEVVNVDPRFAIAFGLLAFTTFVYDTLDVCTRLGRYIFQELTGMQGRAGRWIGTGAMVLLPLIFLMDTPTDEHGKLIPAWKKFWSLFGASNQLLAALTLIGVTVWLHRTYKKVWVWFVAGLPTVFMYTMSCWALTTFVRKGFYDKEGALQVPRDPVPWVAVILLVLAALVAIEAVRVLAGLGSPPGAAEREPAATPA